LSSFVFPAESDAKEYVWIETLDHRLSGTRLPQRRCLLIRERKGVGSTKWASKHACGREKPKTTKKNTCKPAKKAETHENMST
jgi:hypothetical protein